MQRLFFALWPTAEDNRELLQRARSWLGETNGRAVTPENLHLTLAFLGNVAEAQHLCLEQQAGVVTLPAFTLCFDRLAFWRKPAVVWAGADETPAGFMALAMALRSAAGHCGLQVDRRPPVAHLTLKRKVSRASPAQTIEPLCWRVDRFYLVKSTTLASGPVYERLREWRLR